ncbi:hypothetical protein RKD34_002566 [Streptomyces sp. SAI-218]
MIERQIAGHVDGVGAQVLVDRERGRVDRADERAQLQGGVGRDDPGGPRPVQRPQHALVGDEEALDAQLRCPDGVFDTAGHRVVTAGPQAPAARVGPDRAADVPGAARAGEQAELDVAFVRGVDHLGDLGVGQHPDSAALTDPVDRHVEP